MVEMGVKAQKDRETRLSAIRRAGQDLLSGTGTRKRLSLIPVSGQMRRVFDEACGMLHYAGACRRVGRLMRLSVVEGGEWVGGIVLGSPFPNLRPRDDAFDLTRHALNWRERGLVSPWARENRDYWSRLQLIVNQARTFVFPSAQGRGIGVRAHALLETQGRALWNDVYGPAIGFDTLCTESTSRLFSDNGWRLVGRTKGYTRNPGLPLSGRFEDGSKTLRENAGLSHRPSNPQWWIWVRVLERTP